jgi:transposase-like protein
MRSDAKGVAMVAVVQDGEKAIFPIAIAIVENENEALWTYFLSNIKKHFIYLNSDNVVFVHDNEKGLNAAQKKIYPGSVNSMCLVHIMKGMGSGCNNESAGIVYNLFGATSAKDYENNLQLLGKKVRNFCPKTPTIFRARKSLVLI